MVDSAPLDFSADASCRAATPADGTVPPPLPSTSSSAPTPPDVPPPSSTSLAKTRPKRDPALRYAEPYWWPYRTHVKERWIGRRVLEVVSTEFRDRSVDYYRHALASGVTTVNGVTVDADYILRSSDLLENMVHRHEPPISASPILLLHTDTGPKQFVVISKPGGMPVHATGRYFKHTVLECLKSDFGVTAYSVNRLDRLTSGLMILALTGKASSDLAKEFLEGRVRKEYLARVRGRFPEEEITVDKNLLSIDRQMGLVIVHPDGKEAKTIFKRMHYDEERDESVVHCRPMTGRTHQLRVHLQYLGFPIANDPLYSTSTIWGPDRGAGGLALPRMDASGSGTSTPVDDSIYHDSLESIEARMRGEESLPPAAVRPKIKYQGKMEREVARLREEMKASLGLEEDGLTRREANGAARREPDGPEPSGSGLQTPAEASSGAGFATPASHDILDAGLPLGNGDELPTDLPAATEASSRMSLKHQKKANRKQEKAERLERLLAKQTLPREDDDDRLVGGSPIFLSDQAREIIAKLRRQKDEQEDWAKWNQVVYRAKQSSRNGADPADAPPEEPIEVPEGFCPECHIPLAPDPDPHSLFIYLHAWRYTTENLGEWGTPLPSWAREDWDGSVLL